MSSTNENINIGKRLLYLRESKGLNQEEISDSVGISLRAYQNYERGERTISKELIHALLSTYGVDPVWLLTGDGNMYRNEKPAPRTQAIVEMIESLDDSQKQKIYAVIEDAKQFTEMKKQIKQLNQLLGTMKTA
ncbi:putative transcriptional regulator [Beggiatoa alba B18LD]|uniref:Putative transcriptional regulator n=1 Tax=Beggiatoa alba B18LD TaxID=395493 RepID=I3CK60_9GAMM|nr:helix-turn-helix domain-containing protein [Beggiatoa alba]EIJ44003.1 putative transcriptional regulator [Beggiatoa alba B18LD]